MSVLRKRTATGEIAEIITESYEVLEEEIARYYSRYPSIGYSTTMKKEPWETEDGRFRATLQRWSCE